MQSGAESITDQQIQEALWHYYYDVGKSVTYLLGTVTPKTPKTPKKAAVRKDKGGSFLLGDSNSVAIGAGMVGSGLLGGEF